MKIIMMILMLCQYANASIVETTPAKESLMGIGLFTKVSYSGTSLALTGIGVGRQKVALSHANVAVNQFFTEKNNNFIRTLDGALGSLNNTGMNIMIITLLRAVSVLDLQSQIDAYLNANIEDSERSKYITNISAVLGALASESTIYYGKTLTIICNPYAHEIVYENSVGDVKHIPVVDNHFLTLVLSPWLGVTINQDAFNLKSWLLQQPSVTGEK